MKNTIINQPVDVTAIEFGRGMLAIPRRMEFGGQTYNFIDRGIATAVGRGERLAHVMTLSDGLQNFSLAKRHGRWFLLSICA